MKNEKKKNVYMTLFRKMKKKGKNVNMTFIRKMEKNEKFLYGIYLEN